MNVVISLSKYSLSTKQVHSSPPHENHRRPQVRWGPITSASPDPWHPFLLSPPARTQAPVGNHDPGLLSAHSCLLLCVTVSRRSATEDRPVRVLLGTVLPDLTKKRCSFKRNFSVNRMWTKAYEKEEALLRKAELRREGGGVPGLPCLKPSGLGVLR